MAKEELVHAAHEVADAFVKQYYQILRHMPHEARRLYVETSVVTRPGPDGSTMLSFNSLEDINAQFLWCDYEGLTFDVLSVDSQNLSEDGVFVMVIGFSTGKNNIKRRFSQMFYLARQNGVDGSYVVLNDMFRYVDEEVAAPITPQVVESMLETETEKLNKAELIHKIDVENSVNVVVEVKNVVAEETSSMDNGNIDHCNEEVVMTAQKPTEAEPLVAETAASPQGDGAKRTFAAIVQSMARNATPFQVKAPVQKPKYTGRPRAAATSHQTPSSTSNYEKRNEHKIIDEPGTSIFVANLPRNAMPHQLHGLFKEFGAIKENGIQIRNSRANGVCFGFIAFETANSVQNALQAAKKSPFVLEDHKLRVKEKQVEGSKPSGGRNRRNGDRTERRGDKNVKGDGNNHKNSRQGGEALMLSPIQTPTQE